MERQYEYGEHIPYYIFKRLKELLPLCFDFNAPGRENIQEKWMIVCILAGRYINTCEVMAQMEQEAVNDFGKNP